MPRSHFCKIPYKTHRNCTDKGWEGGAQKNVSTTLSLGGDDGTIHGLYFLFYFLFAYLCFLNLFGKHVQYYSVKTIFFLMFRSEERENMTKFLSMALLYL